MLRLHRKKIGCFVQTSDQVSSPLALPQIAAAYITIVDGPAMLKMNPDAALEYWQAFFPSAAKLQARSLSTVAARPPAVPN